MRRHLIYSAKVVKVALVLAVILAASWSLWPKASSACNADWDLSEPGGCTPAWCVAQCGYGIDGNCAKQCYVSSGVLIDAYCYESTECHCTAGCF
jgi:hypothetical protein